MRLAIGIQHRGASVLAHAYGPALVAAESRGSGKVAENLAGFGLLKNLNAVLHDVVPKGDVVGAEAKVNYRNGNPITVEYVRVNGNPIFRPCHHLSPASELDESRLEISYLLLKLRSEPLQVSRLIGEQESGIVQLVMKPAHVILLAAQMIKAGNVRVVCRPVVVHRRRSGKFVQIAVDFPGDISVEIP